MTASIEHPERFAMIFDRHHESVHRFLWTRVGVAADDVAAEVFRIAFERRRTFDASYRSAKPWLFGIAANLAREHHRMTARRRDTHERVVTEERREPPVDPEERLSRLADTAPVAEAIRALPDRDREPLLLFAWEDLSYDEISQVLDVPVGTVRSRIHRARARLRERLDTGLGDGKDDGANDHAEPVDLETGGERR